MHNLKKMGGTFKGLSGECMFRLVRKRSYITRFFPIEFVLRRHSEMLSEKKIKFLMDNWLSFDAIEFFDSDIIIYEIKTRNVEYSTRYKIQTTQQSVNALNQAKLLGFNVKLAKVLLHNDWNYEIKFSNFNYHPRRMWINNHNNYDKSSLNYKSRGAQKFT